MNINIWLLKCISIEIEINKPDAMIFKIVWFLDVNKNKDMNPVNKIKISGLAEWELSKKCSETEKNNTARRHIVLSKFMFLNIK